MRRHFADLRRRYGAPVVVLDLVKQRANERVPRESLLGDEYARAVAVVNGAMPESERVRNVRYDFSHQAKARCCMYGRSLLSVCKMTPLPYPRQAMPSLTRRTPPRATRLACR